MDNIVFVGTAWSLLPPFIAILLIILTHRTLLSLGIGSFIGALMITDFHPLHALNKLLTIVRDLVWSEPLNTWTINIVLFLILLGVIAAFIVLSGGKEAFVKWGMMRIKTQRNAGLFTVLLGFIIFIDGYFSTLLVGNISRPITDKQKMSRAKLAYLLDSTAAPICSIVPLSSWAVYIISIFGTLFVTLHISDYSPMGAFIAMIPFNFYALFALIMVTLMAATNWDIGPMRKHQDNAARGELFDATKGATLGTIDMLSESDNKTAQTHHAALRDLVFPLLALVIATLMSFVMLGYYALPSGESVSIFTLLAHADVSLALLIGAVTGTLTSIVLLLPKKLPWQLYRNASIRGCQAMLPAISILFLAWILIEIIEGLQTGTYLVNFLKQTISFDFLPFLFFIVAAMTAFATGTSWGTFGILLPIAAEVSVASGSSVLLMPCFGAVMAGSVFGDHCSPISDTTILATSGAGSHLIDHVVTQLPYAIFCAFVAGIGYFMMAFVPAWSAFACASAAFIGGIVWMRIMSQRAPH